jgi:hypothetical protein
MKCVILQPSYIPWRGYFHQVFKADLFIFYDDVTFDKGGWRNRNRVKTPNGVKWLTIPVTAPAGQQLHQSPINRVEVCLDQRWQSAHWNTLRHCYSRAPYFKRYASLLDVIYQSQSPLLCDYLIDSTLALSQELGIRHTQFRKSSEIAADGAKTDRLVSLLTSVGATHYISGPAARNYLEEDKLQQAGITLEYMSYQYPEYPQLYPPFDSFVSILDLLFMKGPEAPDYIWQTQATC